MIMGSSGNFFRKIRSMRKVFLFAMLIPWITTSGQTYHQKLAEIAVDQKLIGMAVIVVCEDEVVDTYFYGQSDLQSGKPIDASTRFRVASISKMMTTTALMQLWADGLFELDDAIGDYLDFPVENPNYPGIPITFRQLMNHTSGLRDGNGYFNFLSATYSQTPPPPISELLLPGGSYYTADIWTNTLTGSYFTYSNLSAGVIATLIEQLSGQRFDRYVRDSLLLPLGIEGSFNVQDVAEIDEIAVLYRNGNPQSDDFGGQYPDSLDLSDYSIGDNGVIFSPQGGLRVSPLELSHFLRLHASEGTFDGVQLLDPSVFTEMHSPLWTYDGGNGNNYFNLFNQWGLGVHQTINTQDGDIVWPGLTCYGHPGEAYGLISDLYFAKEPKLGVVFMTNGYYGPDDYSFGDYSAFYIPEEQVFATVYDHFFDGCQPNAGQSVVLPELQLPNPAFGRIQIDASHLNGYVLEWVGMNGQVFDQRVVKDSLVIDLSLFPAGLYFLKWTSPDGESVVKKQLIIHP
jgi:CubicO group peptidase (beta-lactamase class C family)